MESGHPTSFIPPQKGQMVSEERRQGDGGAAFMLDFILFNSLESVWRFMFAG